MFDHHQRKYLRTRHRTLGMVTILLETTLIACTNLSAVIVFPRGNGRFDSILQGRYGAVTTIFRDQRNNNNNLLLIILR